MAIETNKKLSLNRLNQIERLLNALINLKFTLEEKKRILKIGLILSKNTFKVKSIFASARCSLSNNILIYEKGLKIIKEMKAEKVLN